MGIKQSLYERSGSMDHIKLSVEEQEVIRDIWAGIEKNPQFHGITCFTSFLAKHKEYVKFFTLEAHGPMNFDSQVTVKFTIIMEAMGYLLLDFHRKPKQMDRLIAYIAMAHKDMRLDKNDLFNFGYHMTDYMTEMFPAKMTTRNQEIFSKFLLSILDAISRKMEVFRNYEMTYPGIVTDSLKLPCGQCTLFSHNRIFGKSKHYWNERKQQWNIRQDEWVTNKLPYMEPVEISSSDDEDIAPKLTFSDEKKNEILSNYIREDHLTLPRQSKFKQSVSTITLMNLAKKLDARDSKDDSDNLTDYTEENVSRFISKEIDSNDDESQFFGAKAESKLKEVKKLKTARDRRRENKYFNYT